MKLYRSPPNNSDGIFSVSFPYRFRIVSVSIPYRFRIVLLSSSYHPPIAKRKTIRNGTKNERMRFGGTRGQFYYLFISKILLQWQDSMEFFPNLKVL